MKLTLLLLSLLVIHISSQSTISFIKSFKLYWRSAGQKVTVKIYYKKGEHAIPISITNGTSILYLI